MHANVIVFAAAATQLCAASSADTTDEPRSPSSALNSCSFMDIVVGEL